MSRERWDNSKSPDDDALVYAVRGEKWRGRKKSGTVSREVKGGREGREREESRQENKITARDALAAKDFDCVHEVLNFFAVQKVAPLTS